MRKIIFMAVWLWCAAAQAADVGLGVRLDCLPSAGNGADMRGWLQDRLALRGLDPDAAQPAWALCFAEGREQRLTANPAWGAGGAWPDGRYGAYWSEPAYLPVEVRTLSLSVKRVSDGGVLWQSSQALDGSGSQRQRIEAAARRLIDGMPLP
nr:hypothetical protein [Chromobacterium sp. ASV5]